MGACVSLTCAMRLAVLRLNSLWLIALSFSLRSLLEGNAVTSCLAEASIPLPTNPTFLLR